MKEKTAMAYKAMDELGIERQRVKPVLKRILYEYENHWEHIEAENYRALVDAIFEVQDSQVNTSF
jgi:Ubiquitin-binding WIYLD domain